MYTYFLIKPRAIAQEIEVNFGTEQKAIFFAARRFFLEDEFAIKHSLKLCLNGSFPRNIALNCLRREQLNKPPGDIDFQITRDTINPKLEQDFNQNAAACFLRFKNAIAPHLPQDAIITHPGKWISIHLPAMDFSLSYLETTEQGLISSIHNKIDVCNGHNIFYDINHHHYFLHGLIHIPNIQALLAGELTLSTCYDTKELYQKNDERSEEKWRELTAKSIEIKQRCVRVGHLRYTVRYMPLTFKYESKTEHIIKQAENNFNTLALLTQIDNDYASGKVEKVQEQKYKTVRKFEIKKVEVKKVEPTIRVASPHEEYASTTPTSSSASEISDESPEVKPTKSYERKPKIHHTPSKPPEVLPTPPIFTGDFNDFVQPLHEYIIACQNLEFSKQQQSIPELTQTLLAMISYQHQSLAPKKLYQFTKTLREPFWETHQIDLNAAQQFIKNWTKWPLTGKPEVKSPQTPAALPTVMIKPPIIIEKTIEVEIPKLSPLPIKLKTKIIKPMLWLSLFILIGHTYLANIPSEAFKTRNSIIIAWFFSLILSNIFQLSPSIQELEKIRIGFENSPWDHNSFIKIIIILQFFPQCRKTLLQSEHRKTKLLEKILLVYENLARLQGKNEIDLGKSTQMLDAIEKCYGSLEMAGKAKYLFFSEKIPVLANEIPAETTRREMNNRLLTGQTYPDFSIDPNAQPHRLYKSAYFHLK